jgi:RNA polymerase sigma-70 factor (ECF subfamily)
VTLAGGLARERDSDAALVIRAAAGDRGAFDDLIGPRIGRLFRMARAILRDDFQARDVVQETCVSAWRELASVRESARFDGWLSQILINQCRTQLRTTSRRQVREIPIDDRGDAGGAAAAATRAIQPGPGLSDRVVEAEAIRRAFARLGPDDRALLVMHYVEDRPIGEIGAALRTPSGTVKWRLSRARAALERALEAQR